MTTERVRLACQCGATLTGTATPPLWAQWVRLAFRTMHQGDGHGPATLAEAHAARRRQARAATRDLDTATPPGRQGGDAHA